MTFMRSRSGIRNYALFHGVSLTIYIEGRCTVENDEEDGNEQRTFDEIFYFNVLKQTHPKLGAIIKPLGSKANVLAYAQEICTGDISNAFVIIDKDHENLISSVISHPKVVRTFGYSWENDFWSRRLCLSIINDLTFKEKNQGREKFYSQYARFEHRLSRISKVDLVAKCHGLKYIPNSKKSVGVNIDSSHFGASFKSVTNFKKNIRESGVKFSNCDFTKLISQKIKRALPQKIVRGHLWEHACLNLICRNYKIFTRETSIPHALVKRIGFNKFSESPKRNFDSETYKHYKECLAAAVLASKSK